MVVNSLGAWIFAYAGEHPVHIDSCFSIFVNTKSGPEPHMLGKIDGSKPKVCLAAFAAAFTIFALGSVFEGLSEPNL